MCGTSCSCSLASIVLPVISRTSKKYPTNNFWTNKGLTSVCSAPFLGLIIHFRCLSCMLTYHTKSEPVMKLAYLPTLWQAKCHDFRMVTSWKSLDSTKQRCCLLLWIGSCTEDLRHHSLKANCNEILDHVKSLVWDREDTEQSPRKILRLEYHSTHYERLTETEVFETKTYKNTIITAHWKRRRILSVENQRNTLAWPPKLRWCLRHTVNLGGHFLESVVNEHQLLALSALVLLKGR